MPRALPITAPLRLPRIALRLTREHRDRSDAVSAEGWARDRIVAAVTAEGIPRASGRPPCR